MAELIRDSTGQAIGDLRGSIARLRRPSVDDDGLSATLTRFARTFSRQSGVVTSVQVARGADRLPMSVAVLLYECAQEALTNVARHAQASTATVRLRADGWSAELRVSDDGIGAADREDDVDGLQDGSGLALGIYDLVDPGDLTRGRIVAGTGEIGMSGEVGPVGGIRQKIESALRVHADVFVVPTVELEQACAVSKGMPVIGVDNLKQAIEVLRSTGGINARSCP